jgi:hypothetical protein
MLNSLQRKLLHKGYATLYSNQSMKRGASLALKTLLSAIKVYSLIRRTKVHKNPYKPQLTKSITLLSVTTIAIKF